MEKKSFNLEIKAILQDNTNGPWIVEGYASTFDIDSGGDKILPGSFKKSINERFTQQMLKNGKSKIKVLWQHDQACIIGKLLEISENDNGLYVKLELFNDPSFPESAKAYKLLKMGEIFCFSIGYKVPVGMSEEVELGDGNYIRLLKEVVIFEVSLVTFPMNEKAEVTNVKKETNSLMSEQAVELLKEIKSLLQQLQVKEIKSEEDLEEKANAKKPMAACAIDPSTLETPHAPESECCPDEETMEVESMNPDADPTDVGPDGLSLDACKADDASMDKCPTCGAMSKGCGKPKKEDSSLEMDACDPNKEDPSLMLDECKPKYLTIEEVKAVVALMIAEKQAELQTSEVKTEEKELDLENNVKHIDPLEDFMNYLLNTPISF